MGSASLWRYLKKSTLLRIDFGPLEAASVSSWSHFVINPHRFRERKYPNITHPTFNSRRRHTSPPPPLPATTMEEDANATAASAAHSNGETVVKEETPSAKRKSGDAEEQPESSSSRGKRRRGGGGKTPRPAERYIPPPQKRHPTVGFNREHFDETTYYFEGGLRKVHPYYYDFKTYCKGRWLGKTLLEVFETEFRSESIDYYQRAAKDGRIRLNETPVEDLSIVLRNNDLMKNTVHRHEPPVVGRPLEVLADDGEVLVVNKPASIPVHPCGRYRHNTVIFILGKELGVTELHTVHRLDRLTSGVLLFARTLEMSKKLDQLVRERRLEKEYVCRVDGEFPEEELVCEEPILVVSFKVGLCRVDPKGKDCRTVFQRLSFNGSTSVVRCRPLTGRTHQIRVHLQYLGFPIVNDPIYATSAWGPLRGKGGQVGKSDEELLKDLVEEHRSKESLYLLDIPDEEVKLAPADGKPGVETLVSTELENKDSLTETGGVSPVETGSPSVHQDGKTRSNGSSNEVGEDISNTESHPVGKLSGDNDSLTNSQCHDTAKASEEQTGSDESLKAIPTGTRDFLCNECKIVRQDPTEKELVMYLHALRYKGPDFEYSTSLPDWAKEDWVEDE